VTHRQYADDICTRFLKSLSLMLYDNVPSFKKDPQGIIELPADTKLYIHDLHSKFKDPENLDKTV
jgi:hypothetical protein